MRLIDADKLLEETRRDRDYAEKNGFMDMYHERQALIDRIEAQPTAYDPDKVVEKLEDRKRLIVETFKISESDIDRGRIYGMDKAIEIVKGGGVNG
ncbi:MAG: hypothetical protein ACLRTZ_02900 [Agathobacter sp.]|jgi:hypothetical protein